MTLLDQIKPCDTNRPYIFVSYSSFDRELVWQDVLEFQRRGYNIWLDDKNLDKTKDSWKKDALTAIEDYCCTRVIFYVSAHSLTSEACYQELSHTRSKDTCFIHDGDVKFIAVETEPISDIIAYRGTVHKNLMTSSAPKDEKHARAKILGRFVEDFFDTNNEKVRVHPKDEPNRKMDYYEEITASFPDETKIYEEAKPEEPAEPVTAPVPDPAPVPDETPAENPEETAVPVSAPEDTPAEAKKDGKTADFSLETEAESWYLAGLKYKDGCGTEKNPEKAADYFRMAAECGHPDAQFQLAYAYLTGEGVSPDQEKHLFWLRKSAEQENVDALFFLGMYYSVGKGGVECDPEKGEALILKLSDKAPDRVTELLEILDSLTLSANDENDEEISAEAEPVPEITEEESAIPMQLIEKAVIKHWKYFTFFSDLKPKQIQNIRKHFELTDRHFAEENFCAIRFTSILDSGKEGYLLSDQHLYIAGDSMQINDKWVKKAVFDLRQIEKIVPLEKKNYFDLYMKDGTILKNFWIGQVREKEVIDLLNYIIEHRP